MLLFLDFIITLCHHFRMLYFLLSFYVIVSRRYLSLLSLPSFLFWLRTWHTSLIVVLACCCSFVRKRFEHHSGSWHVTMNFLTRAWQWSVIRGCAWCWHEEHGRALRKRILFLLYVCSKIVLFRLNVLSQLIFKRTLQTPPWRETYRSTVYQFGPMLFLKRQCFEVDLLVIQDGVFLATTMLSNVCKPLL